MGVELIMVDILGTVAILAGFAYAFVNGYHDGGNVIATIIASRSIKIRTAFIVGCTGEFCGALFLGTAVAKTIGIGLVDSGSILGTDALTGSVFIIGAITGSIIWNLITAVLGLPSSSSHALMGSLAGAGIALFGFGAVHWTAFLLKVVLVMISSPLVGLLAGYLIMRITLNTLEYYTKKIEKQIKRAQYVSMTGLAMSHGSSDAQKAMGLIALELSILGYYDGFVIPWWVIAGSALMIALGMSVGGWKIMHTLGKKLYTIEPMHSLASQTAAAAVIITAALTGLPVSTTQIVTSSVMGVGAAENRKKVRWGIANRIIASWFITLPASAIVAGVFSKAALLLLHIVL